MHLVIVLDVVGVVIGTVLGCKIKKYLSAELSTSIDLALAVVSVAIGISLLLKAVHMSAAVIAFLLGGVLGHYLHIDYRLKTLSNRLPDSGTGETADLLLMAFTLYCISTTGIIGALELGFSGDATVLMTKAIMDFTASVFFATKSGWTLSLISVPLLGILVFFYTISKQLMPCLTSETIGDFSACGGLIQLLNGLRIAKIKNPPVADYMPALILVFGVSILGSKFM